MITETAQMPAVPLPFRTWMFSLFSPPMALTLIGTALTISLSVSTEVRTVFTFVVVGKIAPTPR